MLWLVQASEACCHTQYGRGPAKTCGTFSLPLKAAGPTAANTCGTFGLPLKPAGPAAAKTCGTFGPTKNDCLPACPGFVKDRSPRLPGQVPASLGTIKWIRQRMVEEVWWSSVVMARFVVCLTN